MERKSEISEGGVNADYGGGPGRLITSYLVQLTTNLLFIRKCACERRERAESLRNIVQPVFSTEPLLPCLANWMCSFILFSVV